MKNKGSAKCGGGGGGQTRCIIRDYTVKQVK